MSYVLQVLVGRESEYKQVRLTHRSYEDSVEGSGVSVVQSPSSITRLVCIVVEVVSPKHIHCRLKRFLCCCS